MTTITFDKLAYVDKLTAAGVEEQMARAMADGLDAALREQVATKADIAPLATKAELQTALEPVKADIRLLKWMVGTNTTLLLIVLGKLLLLP